MNPHQRQEYIEAVILAQQAAIADRVVSDRVAAARIVDRIIAPALAYAWDEGRQSWTGATNPYTTLKENQ